jgi:hypothetical protein
MVVATIFTFKKTGHRGNPAYIIHVRENQSVNWMDNPETHATCNTNSCTATTLSNWSADRCVVRIIYTTCPNDGSHMSVPDSPPFFVEFCSVVKTLGYIPIYSGILHSWDHVHFLKIAYSLNNYWMYAFYLWLSYELPAK